LSGKQTAPIVGVGAVVWKDDRLLLIRRGRNPRKGSWSLPGGRQELGETVNQAAAREIREETGIEIRILDTLAVIDLIDRDGDAIAHHYTVIDVQAEWVAGEARAGDDAEAVAWVRPDQLDGYDLTEKLREVIAASARLRKA
jgi:ADP-ribose pyrophosphatase YjhB (NUDIX family)